MPFIKLGDQPIVFKEQKPLLDEALLLGGKSLVRVIQMLIQENVVLPIPEREVMRYRNVGKLKAGQLIQLGLVIPKIPGLSTRAANCLLYAGINTKAQAIKAINEGKLTPYKEPYPSKERGVIHYGLKTHREICEWVGIPVTEKIKRVKLCPHCGKKIK